jgi:hypothetical protein
MAALISGAEVPDNVIVVDWSARRRRRPGGTADLGEVAAAARLRQELSDALREQRVTDAARALKALGGAGVPDAELEADAAVILMLSARKLKMARIAGSQPAA